MRSRTQHKATKHETNRVEHGNREINYQTDMHYESDAAAEKEQHTYSGEEQFKMSESLEANSESSHK